LRKRRQLDQELSKPIQVLVVKRRLKLLMLLIFLPVEMMKKLRLRE